MGNWFLVTFVTNYRSGRILVRSETNVATEPKRKACGVMVEIEIVESVEQAEKAITDIEPVDLKGGILYLD